MRGRHPRIANSSVTDQFAFVQMHIIVEQPGEKSIDRARGAKVVVLRAGNHTVKQDLANLLAVVLFIARDSIKRIGIGLCQTGRLELFKVEPPESIRGLRLELLFQVQVAVAFESRPKRIAVVALMVWDRLEPIQSL